MFLQFLRLKQNIHPVPSPEPNNMYYICGSSLFLKGYNIFLYVSTTCSKEY